MITDNFKKVMSNYLIATTLNNKGLIDIKTTRGTTYYLGACHGDGFPRNQSDNLITRDDAGGYAFGSGTKTPEVADYCLQSPIYSGLTLTRTGHLVMDTDGIPYKQVDLNLYNNSDANKIISEIGYVQYVIAFTAQNGTSTVGDYFLFDRVVLPEPVTIAPNDYHVFRYVLKMSAMFN